MNNSVNEGLLNIGQHNSDGVSDMTMLTNNDEEFRSVSQAVNIAVTILNKPKARAALLRLGELCVQEWARITPFHFTGNPLLMDLYVEEFLRSLQVSFPPIALEHFINVSTIAETTRYDPRQVGQNGEPGWDGDLLRYNAGQCCQISLCSRMIGIMADAGRSRDVPGPIGAAASAQWHMRMFGCVQSLVHELTHIFKYYLAGNDTSRESVTPCTIQFPGYENMMPCGTHGIFPIFRGECGRWMEGALWGGAIEYIGDQDSPTQNEGQPGIPFVLDAGGWAHEVDAACLYRMINDIQGFNEFPLTTTGTPVSHEERLRRFIRLR